MAELRAREGVSALALQLAILTAARTKEIIEARRAEFDLPARMWTVPADHMRAGCDARPFSCPR